MSGITGSKLNIRGSNRVSTSGTDGQVLTSSGAGVAANYEDFAGGLSWQAVETGSTMTAVAGEGYWVDTSSNACTITLPSSASVGDTIVFADYARNWGTNAITIDSNGLNYQGEDDTFDVEYATDGTALRIVYMDATQGWIPTLDEAVADVPTAPPNDNGIFLAGANASGLVAESNIVSNAGVVATDVTLVGTTRRAAAGCEYGGDKGIYGYGDNDVSLMTGSNLISNLGVVSADVAGVGTARNGTAACSYGGDKGIFGYGTDPGNISLTNLVSNTGVIAADVTGVGTARGYLAACEYGGDKGIFGFGNPATAVTNLVSNAGVVATDTTGVGTARLNVMACSYGGDKGIFGFGSSPNTAITNLVSNAGVVATDTAGVGTARYGGNATQYGQDKGIVAYGNDGGYTAVSNLVSNSGVVASDVTGVGTIRYYPSACSYN